MNIEGRINDVDDINVTTKNVEDGPAIKQAIFRFSVFSPSQTLEVRVSPDLLELGVLEYLKTKLDQKIVLPIEDHSGTYPDAKGALRQFRFYRVDPCIVRRMDADGFTLGPSTSSLAATLAGPAAAEKPADPKPEVKKPSAGLPGFEDKK